MRIKILLALITLALFSYGQENYNGFLDTTSITDTLMHADSVAYSAVYGLSKNEDIRLLVKANDTSSAVYATDSVGIFYGYQTGHVTLNSSGVRDTAWDGEMIIDTMLSSEFGDGLTGGVIAPSGVLTRLWGGADTLNITGYAYQTRWFVPEWDVLIRYFVRGMDENNKASAIELILEHKRRIFIPMRNN